LKAQCFVSALLHVKGKKTSSFHASSLLDERIITTLFYKLPLLAFFIERTNGSALDSTVLHYLAVHHILHPPR